MPFYTWLRPDPSDAPGDLEMKARSSRNLRALRRAFESHVAAASLSDTGEPPADSSRYVRLATWNIREFDSASYGYRTPESKAYIAEIIANFDLVAVQEVREDLRALEDIKRLLGPSWTYIATDVTEGSAGNRERMAFLFNRDRVWFRDVAGELTLPHGMKVTDPMGERFRVPGGPRLQLPGGETIHSPSGLRTDVLASGETKIDEDVEIPLPEETRVVLPRGSALRFAKNARVPLTANKAIDIEATDAPRLPEAAEIVLPPNSLVGGSSQFARTPFVASFQSGGLKLNLATVHIYYGSGSAGIERRKEEIRQLTRLLAERAASDNDSDAEAYFIALGDFNIVGRNHETMDALLRNDFVIPNPLQSVPGSNVEQDKFYDQIALWNGESSRRRAYTRMVPYRAGVFDFFETVYRSEDEPLYRPLMKKPGTDEEYDSYARWRTHQMSDHLPMWVELKIDFTEEYLDDVDKDLQQRLEEGGG